MDSVRLGSKVKAQPQEGAWDTEFKVNEVSKSLYGSLSCANKALFLIKNCLLKRKAIILKEVLEYVVSYNIYFNKLTRRHSTILYILFYTYLNEQLTSVKSLYFNTFVEVILVLWILVFKWGILLLWSIWKCLGLL